MKKTIQLTEQQLLKIIKRVIREQSSTFNAIATVERDMIMDFPVKELSYVNGTVTMTMQDPTSNKLLKVVNFTGPIFDIKTNQKVYKNSYFSNINMKNYGQIAKSNNIPFMTT